MENKYYSPDFDGVELKKINDSLYQCPITFNYYYKNDDGKIKVLESPGSGAPLVPTDNPNIFHDKYSGLDCYVYSDGTVKALDGGKGFGTLHYNEEGNLISDYTGNEFKFDVEGRRFIPLFNPDTQEPSHIEGNELVGNETGERFQIAEDGGILTPQEIVFRAVKARENEIIKHYNGNPDELMMALNNDKELNRLKKEWRSIIRRQAWLDNSKKFQFKKMFKGIRAGMPGIDDKIHCSSTLKSGIEATEDTRMGVIESSIGNLTKEVENSRDEHIRAEGKDR